MLITAEMTLAGTPVAPVTGGAGAAAEAAGVAGALDALYPAETRVRITRVPWPVCNNRGSSASSVQPISDKVTSNQSKPREELSHTDR